MKHVKIPKHWDKLSEQKVCGDDGDEWLMPCLIDNAKDLEPFDIPLRHLSISNKTIGGISIRDFVAHMRLVLEADLSYPIILDEDGAIFDGRHRVAKALFNELEVIKAVRFDEDPEPDIKKD